MGKILIVGIGNFLLRDEGVGVHAVKQLQETGLPEGVEAVDGGTDSYNLVEVFSEARDLIIVDAMKAGGEPGTIYRARLEDLGLKPEENALSLHEMHFIEAISMTNMLGYHPRVVVFGVEPREITWGVDLTPEVAVKLPRLIELIQAEIAELKKEST